MENKINQRLETAAMEVCYLTEATKTIAEELMGRLSRAATANEKIERVVQCLEDIRAL